MKTWKKRPSLKQYGREGRFWMLKIVQLHLKISPNYIRKVFNGADTVSYTHRDVYKRQAIGIGAGIVIHDRKLGGFGGVVFILRNKAVFIHFRQHQIAPLDALVPINMGRIVRGGF